MIFQVASNLLKTVSNVIQSNRTVVAEAQIKTSSSSAMLRNLDELASKLGDVIVKTNNTIQIRQPNIAVSVKYSKPERLRIIAEQNSNKSIGVSIVSWDGFQNHGHPEQTNDTGNEMLANSSIPKEVFGNKSQVVFTILFKEDTLFQVKDSNDMVEKNSNLLSKVLAITVRNSTVEDLSQPIKLKFKKTINEIDGAKTEKEKERISNCSFWKTDERKINQTFLN